MATPDGHLAPALALIALVAACARSADGTTLPPGAGAVSATIPPGEHACSSDADCTSTTQAEHDCCAECDARALSRRELAALNEHCRRRDGDPRGCPSLDCPNDGARDARCAAGACTLVARAAPPPAAAATCPAGALHCFEGNLHRCDTAGVKRELVKDCRAAGEVCPSTGAPACVTSCDPKMENVVLAAFDCQCGWENLSFCAEVSDEAVCSKSLCQRGELGFGVGPYRCQRETDGLVLRGSEVPAPCGTDGQHEVAFEACVDGAPGRRSRREACTLRPDSR